LRGEVAGGFLDSHARANKNPAKALEIASFCYAMIELQEEKGLLTFKELDYRRQVLNKATGQKVCRSGCGGDCLARA
jgi:hypothetical protein